jgi:hypothetical protein
LHKPIRPGFASATDDNAGFFAVLKKSKPRLELLKAFSVQLAPLLPPQRGKRIPATGDRCSYPEPDKKSILSKLHAIAQALSLYLSGIRFGVAKLHGRMQR